MKLRLKLYPAILLLSIACCGCFSVDVQTAVNRRGGGTRTVEVIMDPMMAGLYNKTAGSGKLFSIPGQGLQEKPGVKLTGSAKTELEDGSLKLTWNYKSDKVGLFSSGNDSVRINIINAGLWVYYEYLESIPAAKPEPAYPGDGRDVYRIRHELSLPGQIVSHNSDSIQSGRLVWNRPLGQVTASGLFMEARSRELNPWYLLLASISLAAGVGYFYWHKVKPVNNP
ncbi:hypothetical protein HZA73_03400 [candidate division TA06 bacterium]|nr:hypothetical protein [candidate division TA06 bacterium]